MTQPAGASSLLISAGSGARAPSEVEADYTTSHLFINETDNDNVPITVFFNPEASGAVASAEVFTNLNRRDWATATANGVEEGIEPPDGNTITAGDDSHYYKAYAMTPVPGGFLITLHASKTGAYRLTARYRLTSDPPWNVPLVRRGAERARDPQAGSRGRGLAGESQGHPTLRG